MTLCPQPLDPCRQRPDEALDAHDHVTPLSVDKPRSFLCQPNKTGTNMSCCQVAIPFINAGCQWSPLRPHNWTLSRIVFYLAFTTHPLTVPSLALLEPLVVLPTVHLLWSGRSHHYSDHQFHYIHQLRELPAALHPWDLLRCTPRSFWLLCLRNFLHQASDLL